MKLVVIESCYGNTAALGREIAAVVGADCVAAAEAPATLPAGLELLIVGAPTHNMSLPTAASRRIGAERAGLPTEDRPGVAEWIADLAPADTRVVTFDTSSKGGTLLGSAAKAAARALKRRGFARVERGTSFLVATDGPNGLPALVTGELERARSWAAAL